MKHQESAQTGRKQRIWGLHWWHHDLYTRAPNMVLPTRTLVLPISTACSKSPLMPMLHHAAGVKQGYLLTSISRQRGIVAAAGPRARPAPLPALHLRQYLGGTPPRRV